jgi:hypothetical protein
MHNRVKKQGTSSKSLQVGQNALHFFPTPHGELDDNKHQIPQIHWPVKNHIHHFGSSECTPKEGTTEIQFMAVVNLRLTLY